MILVKQTIEKPPVGWDFVNDLPTGEELDAAQSSIQVLDSAGTDLAATMITDKQVSGTVLLCRIIGGTNGMDYTIIFIGKTTVGGVYAGVVYLQVRNP
jgi:hypothetical protein